MKPGMARLVPELIVSDHGASLAFYVNVLGFAVLYGRLEEGFSFLDRDGAQIMIDQRSLAPERDWVAAPLEYPFGRGINLEIEVADLDLPYAACVAHGAQIFLAPEEKWYRQEDKLLGVRQFIVMDPDGYLLRLQQSIGTRPAAA